MLSPQLWGIKSKVRPCLWFGHLVRVLDDDDEGRACQVSSHMPSQGQSRGSGRVPQFPLGHTANDHRASCQDSLPKASTKAQYPGLTG